MKQALDLIFPTDLIQKPIIYELSKAVPVVFNIRRAKVNDKVGEIVLELEGSEADLKKAMQWLSLHGVKAEPITDDTSEG